MTGSGNFDISEWILLQHVNWLSRREGAMAFLCKYAVARKVMGQVRKSVGHGLSGHIYRIDTKAYFDAAVEACLFILTTDRRDGDCEVYESLEATTPSRIIGERDGFIVSNVNHYQKWRHLPTYRKVVLITQKRVGEDTSGIREVAPNTWNYLLKYRALLAQRKSVIYQNRPEFSMFGIGPYRRLLFQVYIKDCSSTLWGHWMGDLWSLMIL